MNNIKKILITGAAGFIGTSLIKYLSLENSIIGVDCIYENFSNEKILWEQIDVTEINSVNSICKKHSPTLVIHCAGIAHQKIGSVTRSTYFRVNSEATENLAKAASKCNPDVIFIFLSTISVYGEGQHITQISKAEQIRKDNITPINEDGQFCPSSAYAYSKLDAENRLIKLYESGVLRNLIILRLAPVYDREWAFNLERRVFAPKRISYIKFGTGRQRMSALARPNLVEFIGYLLKRPSVNAGIEIINVCDIEPYAFNNIIQVFKSSNIFPDRPIITIPLSIILLATRVAGFLLKDKKKWLHSCYKKLASSLVFDNSRMIQTGFIPQHTLKSIFIRKD